MTNPFKAVGRFFASVGKVVYSAFQAAGGRGLTDVIVQEALALARMAARQVTDTAAQREFVVSVLVGRGVPESIARLAVELAVQLLKKEQAA